MSISFHDPRRELFLAVLSSRSPNQHLVLREAARDVEDVCITERAERVFRGRFERRRFNERRGGGGGGASSEGARRHAGERSRCHFWKLQSWRSNMSSERSFFAGSSSWLVRWHECGCTASSFQQRHVNAAKCGAHRTVQKPVFFARYEFALIRRRVSIARFQGQRAEESVHFFSSFQACNTPWHQESAAKWSQEGGRNRAGGLPPATTNVVLLRPSLP